MTDRAVKAHDEEEKPATAQALQAARDASLRYINDTAPGIRRVAIKAGFRYLTADGKAVRDPDTLKRIRALVIPPAYRDVWICPLANGHLQATGRDARGRKQYRYHARWREVRDGAKYGRMVEFVRSLPKLRRRLAADLKLRGLPREKVLAAVVTLLEETLIRVGNEEYAQQNGSFGLTTLRDRHVDISGVTAHFHFKGKSGVKTDLALSDKRLVGVLKRCQDLPGQDLFQYVDEGGQQHTVGSADVNAYLRDCTGSNFTAKDFRTWNGTLQAASELGACLVFQSLAEAKRNVIAAVAKVAERLNNTAAVCRKCYIHPSVIEAYLAGGLPSIQSTAVKSTKNLSGSEKAILSFLRQSQVGSPGS